jgi:hypothetical protein
VTTVEQQCPLTHAHYRDALRAGLDAGYTFATCRAYATDPPPDDLVAVLRHDIDLLPERAPAMAEIEAALGIRATYFVRVHANEYNALSHQNLAILRDIAGMGHEVGLHAEPLDLLASCGIEPAHGIRAATRVLAALLDTDIAGAASHNDVTPDNNLDFFHATGAADLGLRYEAYDDTGLGLFPKSWYVTDGYFWHWRAFDHGVLTDNRDCLCRHLHARRTPLYCLTHPHVWYATHPHRVHY